MPLLMTLSAIAGKRIHPQRHTRYHTSTREKRRQQEDCGPSCRHIKEKPTSVNNDKSTFHGNL